MEAAMSTFVLPLSDPQATLENVGGKGTSLARLSRHGLPVPPGFHISTQAYWHFVTANAIQPRLLEALIALDPADSNSLEAVSHQIHELFDQGLIPPDIVQEVT